jgi:AI-2 transport protein TqsA
MAERTSAETPGPGGGTTALLDGRPLVVLVGLAAVVVVVMGLRAMSDLLGLVFLALVMTVAAHPLRGWFQRRGLPGWMGTAVALVAVYTAILALSVSLLIAGAQFATLIPSYQAELDRMLDGVTGGLEQLGIGEERLAQMFAGFDLGRLAEFAGGLLGGLLGLLSDVFFIVTLVLFMVVDAGSFPQKLARLRGAHGELAAALRGFAAVSRKYLLVTTVFGLVVAVIDTVALAWLGVPVAVLWGLLAFVTNYIPNIGFVIGVVPPAIIALLEGGPGLMLAVVAVYSGINVVIQSFIQPKIVGDAVGLSATITMLSLVFWAATLGALGALLAVPLTLFFKAVLIDADPRARWVTPLLSGGTARDPAPAPAGAGADRGAPAGAGVPGGPVRGDRPPTEEPVPPGGRPGGTGFSVGPVGLEPTTEGL